MMDTKKTLKEIKKQKKKLAQSISLMVQDYTRLLWNDDTPAPERTEEQQIEITDIIRQIQTLKDCAAILK